MSENAGKSGRQDSSLSARRARLRALAQQPGAYNNTAAAQEKTDESKEAKAQDAPFEFYPKDAEEQDEAQESQAAPEPSASPIIEETTIKPEPAAQSAAQPAPVIPQAKPPKETPLPTPEKEEKQIAPASTAGSIPAGSANASDTQNNALVLLGSVESSLNVCAMNLSQLVKTASDQSEALINLRDLIQNQTFFEIGLNLNTLLDSLSAALEPMKAVGELVPSIDQLVATMETRGVMESESSPGKISADQLLMSLSNQLATGEIDPWTFKSAYMAVYPDDHPADLLHRLVELLGTQRLSGTLFRAAYDAVQIAEPPPRSLGTGYGADEISGNDRELLGRIEELTQTNRELQELLDGRSVDVSRKVEEVEEEYAEILASKEQELQEMQDTLSLRIEEFNSRFEELESMAKSSKDALSTKEEEIKAKEEELKRKEEDNAQKASEISQLRTQLSELQDQFRDTVSDLQKQLTSVKQASADLAKASSAPAASVAIQPQMQPQMQPQIQPQVQPQIQPQPMMQQPLQQSLPQPMLQQPEQAKPKPANSGGFFDSTQEMRQAQTQSQLNQQMDTFNSMSRMPASEPAYNQVSASRPSTGYGASPQTTPLPSGGGAGGGGMGSGSYGNGVRAQVFEVIVRQALAGAPWREICAGPMQVNNISPDEVEAEVKKRQDMLR